MVLFAEENQGKYFKEYMQGLSLSQYLYEARADLVRNFGDEGGASFRSVLFRIHFCSERSYKTVSMRRVIQKAGTYRRVKIFPQYVEKQVVTKHVCSFPRISKCTVLSFFEYLALILVASFSERQSDWPRLRS